MGKAVGCTLSLPHPSFPAWVPITPPNPSADLWDLFQPQPHTEEQLEKATTERKVNGCTCPAPRRCLWGGVRRGAATHAVSGCLRDVRTEWHAGDASEAWMAVARRTV